MRAIALGWLILLCGCSAQRVSLRQLPDETPATDVSAAINHSATLAGAAESGANAAAGKAEASASAGASPSPSADAPTLLSAADAPSMYTWDPWERINRFSYRFNARFDEAIFLPVANDYRRLPEPLRAGVHNFYDNLNQPKSIVNYLLQLRLRNGARSLARFVVNSTLGVGGLIDIASRLQLRSPLTGLSATLSTWGVHPGPYLVIPILGPSTLRDGVGLAGDFGVSYELNLLDLYRGWQSYASEVLYSIDQRASTDFRYYATGSPFEYETIRFLYVHKELIEDDALHAWAHPKKRDPNLPAGR